MRGTHHTAALQGNACMTSGHGSTGWASKHSRRPPSRQLASKHMRQPWATAGAPGNWAQSKPWCARGMTRHGVDSTPEHLLNTPKTQGSPHSWDYLHTKVNNASEPTPGSQICCNAVVIDHSSTCIRLDMTSHPSLPRPAPCQPNPTSTSAPSPPPPHCMPTQHHTHQLSLHCAPH